MKIEMVELIEIIQKRKENIRFRLNRLSSGNYEGLNYLKAQNEMLEEIVEDLRNYNNSQNMSSATKEEK